MKKLLPILCLLSLVSCEALDLAKQTKANTETMLGRTGTMYQQVRSGSSSETRDTQMEKIKREDVAIGEKIAAAGKFFKALEFQLWSNTAGFDDATQRDYSFLDATNEFFKIMNDFYANVADDLDKMSPLNLEGAKKNDHAIFYAMAVSMHLVHQYQDNQAQRRRFPVVSFYDLMKGALRKEKSGAAMKDYEREFVTGVNKEITLALLKARYDMLIALGLKNLVSRDDMKLWATIGAGAFQVTGGRIGNIKMKSKFLKSTGITQADINKKLDGAAKVKRLTNELGLELDMHKSMRSILTNIQYDEVNDQEGNDMGAMAANNPKLKEHLNLIEELLE